MNQVLLAGDAVEQPCRLACFHDACPLVCAYQRPVELADGCGRVAQVHQERVAQVRPVDERAEMVVLYGQHISLLLVRY